MITSNCRPSLTGCCLLCAAGVFRALAWFVCCALPSVDGLLCFTSSLLYASLPCDRPLQACTCSGFPLLVKPSEAEKNYAAAAEAAGGSALSALNERRVYLVDVPAGTSDADLRAVAAVVGAVDRVVVMPGTRGMAVITYASRDSADKAVHALNGLDLRAAAGGSGGEAPPLRAGKLNAFNEAVTPDGSKFAIDANGGAGGASGLSAQQRAALSAQLAGATTSAAQTLGSTLMAAGGAGGAGGALVPGITPSSGAGMTGVLAPVGAIPATATLPSSAVAALPGGGGGTALVPPRGVPTPCLLLRGVFDSTVEDPHSSVSDCVVLRCAWSAAEGAVSACPRPAFVSLCLAGIINMR